MTTAPGPIEAAVAAGDRAAVSRALLVSLARQMDAGIGARDAATIARRIAALTEELEAITPDPESPAHRIARRRAERDRTGEASE